MKSPMVRRPKHRTNTDRLDLNADTSTVTLVLSESDFESLVSGKGNAQRLFMSGKLKIKGNVMKATKLDPILKQAQTKAKL